MKSMKFFVKWITCLLVTSLLILAPVMDSYVIASAATTSGQNKASNIKITVAYNANGGTGAPKSHAATVKGDTATYKLSTVVPSRTGYKFMGWRLDNSWEYDIDSPGQSIAIEVGQSGTLVYYAQWEKVEIIVAYYANGGTGAPNSHAATVKGDTATYKLSTVVPSRTGYKFIGWRLENDSAYTIDRPGQSIAIGIDKAKNYVSTVGNGVRTYYRRLLYYAQWEKVAESSQNPSYTITYVLNGGTNHANNPSSYTRLSGVTLYNPVRAGYTFGGWYLDSSFRTKATGIAKGSTGNRTFYAKWIKNPSSVGTDDSASVNGGSSARNAANAGITYYTQGKGYNKFWNGKVWIGSNGTNYAGKSSKSCGICCDAMIASYFGAKLTPGNLLQANKGSASWDGSGVVKLMKKNGLTKNTITYAKENISQKKKKEKLDKCLEKYKKDPGHNGPPMVSIYNKGAGSNHFVLVVGKDKSGNYIIIDPANNERATLIVIEKNTGQGNKTGYKSCIKGIFTWTKK